MTDFFGETYSRKREGKIKTTDTQRVNQYDIFSLIDLLDLWLIFSTVKFFGEVIVCNEKAFSASFTSCSVCNSCVSLLPFRSLPYPYCYRRQTCIIYARIGISLLLGLMFCVCLFVCLFWSYIFENSSQKKNENYTVRIKSESYPPGFSQACNNSLKY